LTFTTAHPLPHCFTPRRDVCHGVLRSLGPLRLQDSQRSGAWEKIYDNPRSGESRRTDTDAIQSLFAEAQYTSSLQRPAVYPSRNKPLRLCKSRTHK